MQISLLQLSVRYALNFMRVVQCAITQKPISCQSVGADNRLLAQRLGPPPTPRGPSSGRSLHSIRPSSLTND